MRGRELNYEQTQRQQGSTHGWQSMNRLINQPEGKQGKVLIERKK